MAQLQNIPEILTVKEKLKDLQEAGIIKEWELPYENILTRLSAAIFFLSPEEEAQLDKVWEKLGYDDLLGYRKNEEKTLSQLEWRFEFKD